MKDTPNQTPVEHRQAEVIDLYVRYWMEHVEAIKEDKIRAQYVPIIVGVCRRLYGEAAALDLGFRLLAERNGWGEIWKPLEVKSTVGHETWPDERYAPE